MESAHTGHHDIKEDDVWGIVADGFDCLEAVMCDADISSEFVEVCVEEFNILLIVIDDEDSAVLDWFFVD